MATTIDGAVDEIFGLLRTAWEADAASSIGASTTPALVFEATEKGLRPHPSESAEPWARAVIRHEGGRQRSLGGVGGRRFNNTGTLWVQVFFPWHQGSDLAKAQSLAQVAKNAYQGKRTPNVTFKAVVAQEKGPDGAFYRWDVTLKFDWLEIK